MDKKESLVLELKEREKREVDFAAKIILDTLATQKLKYSTALAALTKAIINLADRAIII